VGFKKAYYLQLYSDIDGIWMLNYPFLGQTLIFGLMKIHRKKIDNMLEARRTDCFERAFG